MKVNNAPTRYLRGALLGLCLVALLGCSTTNPRRATDDACSGLFFVALHPSALLPAFLACTFGADAVLKDQNEEEEDDCDEDDQEECEDKD